MIASAGSLQRCTGRRQGSGNPERLRIPLRSYYSAVGVIWGLLANFSFMFGEANGSVIQGSGLAVALIAVALERRSIAPLLHALATPIGALISVHAVAALLSGAVNVSSEVAILRYVLLVPAIAIFLSVARRDKHAGEGLRHGLTASGVIFVLYHLVTLDLSSLMDPTYRVFIFLNTNGVGFIAAMTGVSLLAIGVRTRRARLVIFSLFVACCVLCFATKSRTASLALIAGTGAHLYFLLNRSRKLFLAMMAAAVLAFVALSAAGVGSQISDEVTVLYMLDHEDRSIQSGTYRYDAWKYVINDLWLESPILGVGPGNHADRVFAATDVPGAHNGLLANLAEVGIAGTLPLVLILVFAVQRSRRNEEASSVLPLVVTALVESVAEVMFFSMGNGASLLFLAALARLGRPGRRLIVA